MLQRDTSFFGRQPSKFPETQPKAAPVTGNPAAPAARGTPPEATPGDEARKADRPSPAADRQGSQLIVGPNIKLKGVEITDCDTLVVEGHVEATMDSRAIQIAPNGSFAGTAGIDIAEIRGGFSGELTARKCLTIHSTGKISGKIRYSKIVIEEGGEISGDIMKLTDDEKSVRIQHSSMGSRINALPSPHV
jgi:cytoskeletal protein CcmA (bactofilin family)